MHGGQQTGYHRISGISSHLLRARGSNIKVLIISMLPSTAIYNPPQTISFLKVSARVEKYVPPYRGDNEFSILGGGNYTFKTVSDYLILKVSTRAEKSVPHYRGDNGFSILTGGTFTFKTVSPPWSLLTENLSSHVICVLEAADVKTRAVRSQGLCKSERSFGHLPMMPLPQCQRLSDTTNDCRLRQSERSRSLQ